MNYEIIISIGSLLCALGLSFFDMLFGNIHDGAFSKKTLEKLTVNQDSIFRKIMPFKELKGSTRPKYLYIRIIPLIINILAVIILSISLIIDIFFINFVNDFIFIVFAGLLFFIYILYNFILAILARVFKI